MLSLCSTSKLLYQLAVPHLYRNICITSKGLATLVGNLIKSPKLAQNTRQLSLHFGPDYTPSTKHLGMHPDALRNVPVPKDLHDGTRIRLRNRLFADNLAVTLISLIPRLERLRLSENPGLLFRGHITTGLLFHLKELQLCNREDGNVGYYLDTSRVESLRRISPNLETLNLDAMVTTAVDLRHAPPSLKHLKFYPAERTPPEFSGSWSLDPHITDPFLNITTFTACVNSRSSAIELSLMYMERILSCSPELTVFNLQLRTEAYPSGCRLFRHLETLERHTAARRETLRTIRVEHIGPRLETHMGILSPQNFANLEHLTIATRFIKKSGKGVLDFLPSSLRYLNLFKDGECTETELVAFVETAEYRFPNLRTLILRVDAEESTTMPHLEEACKKNSIDLSILVRDIDNMFNESLRLY